MLPSARLRRCAQGGRGKEGRKGWTWGRGGTDATTAGYSQHTAAMLTTMMMLTTIDGDVDVDVDVDGDDDRG